MDMVSLEEGIEIIGDIPKGDGSALVGALDLNSASNKNEKAKDLVYENLTMNDKLVVDLNKEQYRYPLQHVNLEYQNAESPVANTYPLLPSECRRDDIQMGIDEEEERSHFLYECNNHEVQTAALSTKLPFTMDAHHGEEKGNNTDVDKTSPEVKKILSDKSRYESQGSENELDEEKIDYQAEKDLPAQSHFGVEGTESENDYIPTCSTVPSMKLDVVQSGQDSLGKASRHSVPLLKVRRTSASPERSPHIHQSPTREKSFSTEGVEDPLYSPNSRRQKHSPLADKPSPHKDDKIVPSGVQTSTSRGVSAQGSKHNDESSWKNNSSPRHQRKERSISRSRSRSQSPVRRRDSSTRRYSPRHRSPVSHHSRHRSPRRRPWSPPSNRSTGLGKPGKNLFVAGFSFLTTERDLDRKFSKYGRVRDIRIVRDKRSGDSRGFGFLSMHKDEEADAAIKALDKTDWNGRIILVEKSKSSVH